MSVTGTASLVADYFPIQMYLFLAMVNLNEHFPEPCQI